MEYIIIAVLVCIVATIAINKIFIEHHKQKLDADYRQKIRDVDKSKTEFLNKYKEYDKERAEIIAFREKLVAENRELRTQYEQLHTQYEQLKYGTDELQQQIENYERKKAEFEEYRAKAWADINRINSEWSNRFEDFQKRYDEKMNRSFYSQTAELEKEYNERRDELEKEYNQLCGILEKDYRSQFEKLSTQQQIIESQKQSYPFVATMIADAIKQSAISASYYLIHKERPAYKAADVVAEYAHQLKQWTTRAKLAENQLAFFEELFPWLEEFKELPPNDAWDMVKGTDSAESEYDHYKSWISPEEYNRLSRSERNQLALDRYKNRHKSNWEIGIEYERYVGYKYEMRGFRVSYIGATQGLEDMGRDLVAQNKSKTYIIQCKRWAQEKTIHEKHIFQLYGTTVLYKMSHPKENIQPLFVTTADLSDTAKEVAAYLNITIVNNYIVEDYPLIKCNIGKDGEKIYHMPFDQQYDHVVVTPSDGEGYAYTVKEAERLGFRHAYRWHSG